MRTVRMVELSLKVLSSPFQDLAPGSDPHLTANSQPDFASSANNGEIAPNSIERNEVRDRRYLEVWQKIGPRQ